MAFDKSATSRHPDENRGPEKLLIHKTLDAGFRRHDEKKALSGFIDFQLFGL